MHSGAHPRQSARLSVCASWLLCSVLTQAAAWSQEESLLLTVQLRDGTSINVQTKRQTIEWTTLSETGETFRRSVDLEDVEHLQLAADPASKQVAGIRRLVAKLASPNYRERHGAELELLDRGVPFVFVISNGLQHTEPEVRYRAARILEALENTRRTSSNTPSLEFDHLRLTDGEEFEGDVVDWALDCQWGERRLQLGRDRMVSLQKYVVTEPMATAPGGTPIRVESLVSDQKFFADDGTTREGVQHADFDHGPNQEVLKPDRDFSVNDYFAYRGVLFECETNAGYVTISGFKFRHGRSRERSIGNVFVQPETGREVTYQGVMRISFCQPSRRDIPASVSRVGLFLEIVLPKHTTVEAFNSADHLIGSTLASRESSSFTGFDANQPIAYLRIRANTELDVKALNEDYAVDDLVFDVPRVASDINRAPHHQVILSDGQRILSDGIDLGDERIQLLATTVGGAAKEIDTDQVDWCLGPAKERRSIDDGVFVMVRDGSVIHCQQVDPLRSSVHAEITVSAEEVVGFWGTQTHVRYPPISDFNHGQVVVVQPNYRLALPGVSFVDQGTAVLFELEQAKRIEQPIINDADEVKPDDITEVASDQVDERYDLSDSPSVWMHPPELRGAETGLLRTYDGQEFVLGGSFGFSLVSLDGDAVTLAHGSQQFSIALDNVRVLQFDR